MINVYIDSNVIVSSEIRAEANHSASKKFMKYVLERKNANIRFITSVFTFLELASSMIRRTGSKDKTYSILYRIRNTWKDSIYPLPPIAPKKLSSFTRLVDTLIETSITFRTPSADTIHAQTVAANRIDIFTTWNKRHFTQLAEKVENLKILDPRETMEELDLISPSR
jgi:predicted nucleic acid-binding protein